MSHRIGLLGLNSGPFQQKPLTTELLLALSALALFSLLSNSLFSSTLPSLPFPLALSFSFFHFLSRSSLSLSLQLVSQRLQ